MKGFTHTGTFLCKKLDQLSFSSSIFCKCNYYSTFPKIISVSIWRSHKTVFYFNTSLFMWLELSLSVRSHTVQNGGRHCFCFDTEPPVCSSLCNALQANQKRMLFILTMATLLKKVPIYNVENLHAFTVKKVTACTGKKSSVADPK